ncbi:hypothetical protein K461DRAFT_217521, partial [Myriangium duriaei CBS 260.36]
NVPRWNQITSGTSVSIVLKADQPTGRQVQGVVQDLLTRGDHPRGVKVRLTDGRVGRVQRLVNSFGGSAAEPAEGFTTISSGQPEQRFKYRDIRLDDEPEEPPVTNDLSAYIKPAKQKKRKGANANLPAETTAETTVTGVADSEAVCPVCQDFRGDEAAVAFHVESHF